MPTALRFKLGADNFFGPDAYPFDLGLVAARDNTAQQIEFLRNILPDPPATVLDVGCGHGRHLRALHLLGYNAIGIDRFLPTHVQKVAATPTQLVQGDMNHLPVRSNAADGLISMYSSVGYTRPILVSLREWHRVVRPGGLLVLDLAGHASRVRLFRERTRDGTAFGARARFGRRWRQWNVARRPHGIDLYSLSYPATSLRAVSRDLKTAGWRLNLAFGDYAGVPLDDRSPRLIVVACALR